MNRENYKLVLDKITSCPEEWDQKDWHCGATHCFAGTAQILSGKPADNLSARGDARIFLDLSMEEARYLFHTERTLADFNEYYHNGHYPYEYDDRNRNGYDLDDYDLDGLDKHNKPRP